MFKAERYESTNIQEVVYSMAVGKIEPREAPKKIEPREQPKREAQPEQREEAPKKIEEGKGERVDIDA